jgi:hypothetical protein
MVSPAPTTRRSRRHRLRLVASAALGVAVVALTLSGCVSMKIFDAQQQGSIGAIDIVLTGCGSKAATPGCELGNSNLESNATGTGQVLLGLSIDARYVPPASFTTDFPDSQPFTASPSYTAELTRLQPPINGRKWVGYISDTRTYTPGKDVIARVPIIRPALPDGSPNASVFAYGWAIGSRGVLPDAPATRAVACGTDLAVANLDTATICADEQGGFTDGGFNDFVFLTPAPVTIRPGETAIVQVTGKLAGPARPGINLALAASTTVPGATALTNVPTLAPPGDSTTLVTVSVPVPPSTAPGTYAVTLTGTLSSGETRAATGSVVVARPGSGGGVAGVLSGLKISRTSISSARGAAPAVISVTLANPGRLRVLLERVLPGRRKNGVCVAPTAKLRRNGAPRCSRFVAVSSFIRANLGAGVAKVSIGGRAGGRRRVSGTYRVTLTHLSATGAASVPLRTTLTITR